jgi:hypothetical protein
MDLLKFQEAELERQKKVVARVNGFVDRASAAGLTPDNWAYYTVRKQEPAGFDEVERILNQSANSDTYYFKPIRLHLMLRDRKTEEPLQPAAGEQNQGADEGSPVLTEDAVSLPFSFPEEVQGDLLLSLKGSFVVRRE